jgi:hypothetical protein
MRCEKSSFSSSLMFALISSNTFLTKFLCIAHTPAFLVSHFKSRSSIRFRLWYILDAKRIDEAAVKFEKKLGLFAHRRGFTRRPAMRLRKTCPRSSAGFQRGLGQ